MSPCSPLLPTPRDALRHTIFIILCVTLLLHPSATSLVHGAQNGPAGLPSPHPSHNFHSAIQRAHTVLSSPSPTTHREVLVAVERFIFLSMATGTATWDGNCSPTTSTLCSYDQPCQPSSSVTVSSMTMPTTCSLVWMDASDLSVRLGASSPDSFFSLKFYYAGVEETSTPVAEAPSVFPFTGTVPASPVSPPSSPSATSHSSHSSPSSPSSPTFILPSSVASPLLSPTARDPGTVTPSPLDTRGLKCKPSTLLQSSSDSASMLLNPQSLENLSQSSDSIKSRWTGAAHDNERIESHDRFSSPPPPPPPPQSSHRSSHKSYSRSSLAYESPAIYIESAALSVSVTAFDFNNLVSTDPNSAPSPPASSYGTVGPIATLGIRFLATSGNQNPSLSLSNITLAPSNGAFLRSGSNVGLVNVSATMGIGIDVSIEDVSFSLPSAPQVNTVPLVNVSRLGSEVNMTDVVVHLATLGTAVPANLGYLYTVPGGSLRLDNVSSSFGSTICYNCQKLSIYRSTITASQVLRLEPTSATTSFPPSLYIASSSISAYPILATTISPELISLASGTESYVSSLSLTIISSILSGIRCSPSSFITNAAYSLTDVVISSSQWHIASTTGFYLGGNVSFTQNSVLMLSNASGHSDSLFLSPDSSIFFNGTSSFDASSSITTKSVIVASGASAYLGNLDMTNAHYESSAYSVAAAAITASISGPSNNGSNVGYVFAAAGSPPSFWNLTETNLTNISVDMSAVYQLQYSHVPKLAGSYGLSCLSSDSTSCIVRLPNRILVNYSPGNTSKLNENFLLASGRLSTPDSIAIPTAIGNWALNMTDTSVGSVSSFSLYFYDPTRTTPSIAPADSSPLVPLRSPTPASSLTPVYVPPPPICGIGTFTCNSSTGVVTSNVSVTVPTLVVTSGVTSVQISGNLSVEAAIVFKDTAASISVSGCANISSVTLDLSSISTKSRSLITQAGNSCEPLSSTPARLVDNTGSCKKTSISTSSSTETSLNVVFSFDNSGCNTKWIILGTVLGGVVLLGTIGLILLFTLSQSAREWVRPYSKKRMTATHNPSI